MIMFIIFNTIIYVDKLIHNFIGKHSLISILWDFLHFSYCGILSTFHIVGFYPVGFCPVGFCPGFHPCTVVDGTMVHNGFE